MSDGVGFGGACDWCGRSGHKQDTDCPDYPRFVLKDEGVLVRFNRQECTAGSFREAHEWATERAAAARRAETMNAVSQLRRMIRLEEFATQMTMRLQAAIHECECERKGCHICQEARQMLALLRDS